jgi:hypothetical protein
MPKTASLNCAWVPVMHLCGVTHIPAELRYEWRRIDSQLGGVKGSQAVVALKPATAKLHFYNLNVCNAATNLNVGTWSLAGGRVLQIEPTLPLVAVRRRASALWNLNSAQDSRRS